MHIHLNGPLSSRRLGDLAALDVLGFTRDAHTRSQTTAGSRSMAGMKHVPNIVAVNKDAEASIFAIAKYGVVADMFELAQERRNHFS